MDIRQRILEAAKSIYAQHGFRGATTRLIANHAGVNEVTLFRTFGSKAALFEALMQSHVAQSPVPALPDHAVDPQAEMTSWCGAVLTHMRANQSMLRTAIGEVDERPEPAMSMCEGPSCAAMLLTDYAIQLQHLGMASADADVQTAVSMLISSLFGDAMCRDIMPNAFPSPLEAAPRKYVGVFLAALGVNAAKRRLSVSRSGT